MNEPSLLPHFLLIGAFLVGIGLVGFICRRNLIIMFLALEMVLQGVSLSLVAWSRYHNDFGGQVFILFIIALAAAEAAVALALFVVLFRRTGSLDAALWSELREEGIAPPLEPETPSELPKPPADWPRLAPAGRLPPAGEDYRPVV